MSKVILNNMDFQDPKKHPNMLKIDMYEETLKKLCIKIKHNDQKTIAKLKESLKDHAWLKHNKISVDDFVEGLIIILNKEE